MAFHVGQKVVCVDDLNVNYGPWHGYGDLDGLRRGTVYTVRACREYRGCMAIWVHELSRPMRGLIEESLGEPGYAVCRFRPVIERKSQTDIGVFLEILDRETIRDPKATPAPNHTHTEVKG